MRYAIWLLIAVVGLLVVAIPAVASESEEWRRDLDTQMSFDHDCEVSYLTGVIERDIEGQLAVTARVHCLDKRAYDVSRRDVLEPFDVKKCNFDVTTC